MHREQQEDTHIWVLRAQCWLRGSRGVGEGGETEKQKKRFVSRVRGCPSQVGHQAGSSGLQRGHRDPRTRGMPTWLLGRPSLACLGQHQTQTMWSSQAKASTQASHAGQPCQEQGRGWDWVRGTSVAAWPTPVQEGIPGGRPSWPRRSLGTHSLVPLPRIGGHRYSLSVMSPRPWAYSRSRSRVTSSFSSRISLLLGSSLMTALQRICLARSAYLGSRGSCGLCPCWQAQGFAGGEGVEQGPGAWTEQSHPTGSQWGHFPETYRWGHPALPHPLRET